MKPEDNPKIMDAVRRHYAERGQAVPSDIRYGWIIDAVAVYVEGVCTLYVGLPPVSDYETFVAAEK